jgi:hypothetical protein
MEDRLGTTEVRDPATNASGPAGLLAETLVHHTATLLPDGRVRVISGADDEVHALASTEVWDPQPPSTTD